MADVREMKTPYIVNRYNFFGSGPHTITALCAATQFVISISLDSLVGTPFHAMYSGYISKMEEKDDDGFPKYLVESSAALVQMVCNKCLSVFQTYTTTSESFSLQDYIQPSTHHVSIFKDANSQDGVIAKTLGDTQKSYSWGIAPVKVEELDGRAATVEKFKASELLVTCNTTTASLVNQVYTTTGQTFFFKPRFDLMIPEFERELSVLFSIVNRGLHRTLRVSRLAGLVVLDNGLVAGMAMDWLEGLPLAEQNASQNHKFHRVWKEQVEVIVDELHRHSIVWGDVNPHNILIDSNSAAWVIDFGGNCNVQFVDEEIKETYEGDKQGIRRIFEEWLPSKSRQTDHPDGLVPFP